jgi:hypothetical protein
MIRSITRKKPLEEIERLLGGFSRIFIVGCGTCTTLTQTGGQAQVEAMAAELKKKGKLVTGQTVVAVACDNLSGDTLEAWGPHMNQADALLVMSCAYGVQNLGRLLGKMVVPAVDTVFIGQETALGEFNEVCTQCGTCVLGETGGICPVTSCHKGMVNGPCGGTKNGRCEIDENKDCAWTLIYNRLSSLGRLELMRRLMPPRSHQGGPRPGKVLLPPE